MLWRFCGVIKSQKQEGTLPHRKTNWCVMMSVLKKEREVGYAKQRRYNKIAGRTRSEGLQGIFEA
jgi:hypothetical protein